RAARLVRHAVVSRGVVSRGVVSRGVVSRGVVSHGVRTTTTYHENENESQNHSHFDWPGGKLSWRWHPQAKRSYGPSTWMRCSAAPGSATVARASGSSTCWPTRHAL